MAARRMTREEQQAMTRDKVLRAAAKVFARHGFHGASVAQVADEAGFTKGAVYSNFESKGELFASLLEIRCREALEETARLVRDPDTAPQGRLQAVGDRLTQRILDDRDWTRLFFEFWTQSLRNPKLRRRFLAVWGETRAALADLIEDRARETGAELALPPPQIASTALALVDGLALQMMLDPGLIEPATLGTALSLLVAPIHGGEVRTAVRGPLDRPRRRTSTRTAAT